MASNLEIMTAIWNTGSPTFQERVPQPSQANLERIGVLISSDSYEAERNEIFDTLVNVIAKQKVWNKSLTNHLSMFKSGTMTLGDTYEEIMADIIEAQTFRIGEDDQFKKMKPRVESAYHKINREEFYKVTIEETKLPRAFLRSNGLQTLIDSIINKMYSTNDLDEFLYTKETIAKYFKNVEIPVLDTQKVSVPDIRADRHNITAIKDFLMTVKGTMKAMKFAKRIYNPMEFMLECKPEDMILIMTSDIAVINEVSNLSQAFNPEYMNVKVPIIEIDEFPEGMENVVCVAMDRQALKILDVLRKVKTAENAENLYRNYFYHIHQLYMFSAFLPCVFFVAE